MTEEQRRHLEMLQKQMGDRGEDFVLRYERQRLAGHHLADDIRIVGRKDVGMGYDIQSFHSVASTRPDRFIEVKTFADKQHFFLSESEIAVARRCGSNYCVYLVDIRKIDDDGYEPIIIRDPAKTLLNEGVVADDTDGTNAEGGRWQEKVQSREFVYVDDRQRLPDDVNECTVLVGCYRSAEHLRWILHQRYYNVRQGGINGSVVADDVSKRVGYLLLYDMRIPRTYAMYEVSDVTTATRQQMKAAGYPDPHASVYMLYRLTKAIQPTPSIDILQLLRAHNDKSVRSSGTPVFLSGQMLKRFVIGGAVTKGLSNARTYSNEGKPWTEVATMKLRALFLMGKDVGYLAHEFRRNAAEIHSKLKEMGLE